MRTSQNEHILEKKHAQISTINSFVSEPISEIAFISSLYPFEHIGLKWIMSQRFCDWTEAKHKHSFDELRHGDLLLKYVQEKKLQLSSIDLFQVTQLESLTQKTTHKYLKKLFHLVLSKVYRVTSDEDKYHYSYAVLSLLIEKRLMNIYPHMQKDPAPVQLQNLMKKLVEDEFEHLNMVSPEAYKLKKEGLDLSELIKIEEEYISDWYNEISSSIQNIIVQ